MKLGISLVTLTACLALGASATSSVAAPTKVHGAKGFAVFSQPIDTRDDANLIGCTADQAATWNGPKADEPCWAPMRGNSRLVYDPDGQPAAVAPIGSWVCLHYGPSAACQTIAKARQGQLVLYSRTPSSGPGPYRVRLVQLVPNGTKRVRIGRKTFRPERNVVIAKVSEKTATAYLRSVAAASGE